MPPPTDLPRFEAALTRACELAGANALVGVRPMDRGWFACASLDGEAVEVDGGSARAAAEGLASELHRRVEAKLRAAESSAADLRARLV